VEIELDNSPNFSQLIHTVFYRKRQYTAAIVLFNAPTTTNYSLLMELIELNLGKWHVNSNVTSEPADRSIYSFMNVRLLTKQATHNNISSPEVSHKVKWMQRACDQSAVGAVNGPKWVGVLLVDGKEGDPLVEAFVPLQLQGAAAQEVDGAFQFAGEGQSGFQRIVVQPPRSMCQWR
jgi:hypothetical protein